MRGIEVQWLMDFYSERVACLDPEMTTEQVVETIIKPDTAAQGCSYVEVPGVVCAAPQHFVSHAWSRPFHELVECLRRRFASNMSTIVWIDLFGEDPLYEACLILQDKHALNMMLVVVVKQLPWQCGWQLNSV